MKRIVIALLIAALVMPVFAQQTAPASILSTVTSSLFENAIDEQFQANGKFGTLDKDLFYAALGNPGQERAVDAALAGNLLFGYYFSGETPVSLYGSGFATRPVNRPIKTGTETVPTYSNVNVTVGTTTTGFPWISSSTATTYTDALFARTWNAGAQALAKFGTSVVGLQVSMNVDNSALDTGVANDYFRNVVVTTNANTAPALAAPVTALDYTLTASINNLNPAGLPGPGGNGVYTSSNALRVGIPFAMQTGDMEHRGRLTVALLNNDQSGAFTATQSAHAITAGAASEDDIVMNITSKTGATEVDLSYGLRMPAGDSGNLLVFGIFGGFDINTRKYTYDETLRPYDLSVLTAKTAITGGTQTVQNDTYKNGLDFTIGLTGGKIVKTNPLSGMDLRFGPSAYLAFAGDTAAQYTGRTSYTRPLNAEGALDTATAYNTTTVVVSGKPATTTNLYMGLSFPMAMTFMPKDWKFGLILGATPSFDTTIQTSTTSSETTVTTVVNTTGDTTNSTTISTVTNTATESKNVFYIFTENHRFGITLPLDGGARIDVLMNGNLLNFESFTIQAIIPLP